MLKRALLATLVTSLAAPLAHAQAPTEAQPNGHHRQPTLTPQKSNTTQLLIAVSPVDSRVVWASGAGGTSFRTTDGGKTWHAGVVPGAEVLQFRDVQGISYRVA